MLGDDAELTAAVLAAQDGDEDAFRAVYRAVQPRLLGYIRTLVGETDAEDVASEAWLQIARDLDRFSGDADRFRGWTARIARNRSLDHLRMRSRRPAIGGDETELTTRAAESDTAGDAIEALDTDRTMSLIAQLPQDQAEAVVLRVVVGLDAKSAAQTLGKRPGAVRTAAHRGLKRLAELLGAEEAGRTANRPDATPPATLRSDATTPATPRPDATAPATPRPDASPPVTRLADAATTAPSGWPGTGASADAAAPGSVPADGDDAGGGAGLGAVPAQRPGRNGPVAPAGVTPGVTHWRPWTQRDM
ncbi:sigma-70 family RNA polymerase sigma factor [Streptomyces californicus]|uniref:RNA polymerase sigma factor n=1 Tax=Streptomyces californicus TaxID=67351 RepID=UPI00296E9920|nr:sigma-70 family RNA polymerase sigma factor [Streptomyces californicus]MDW4896919.1 sigma-70 family RNA polymerase sigma factor [Streptomyces californicus]